MNTGQWIRDAGIPVALATVVVIGVLAIGTAPVAATGNQATIAQDFGFDDDGDGPGFGFEDGDGPDFGGDGNESDDGPGFDFGDGDSPDFGGDGNESDGGPGFDFGDGDSPGFGGDGNESDDGPDFDFGDGDGPDFGGGDESDDGPGFDFGDGDSPGFGDGNDSDGGDGDGNESDGGTDPAAPADFQLASVSGSGSVTAGDTLDVTATVENVGERESTQTLSLSVAGTERDSQQVTLAAGESQQVTLSWATTAGDAGEYTATVETANDTATTGVTVAAQPDPANFQVSNIESNSPVTEGETLTVDATVQNTGDREGTQTVTLSVLGTSDDQQVTLAGGASTTVTLSVATETGDAGSGTATVTTENDTVSTSVRVNAPDAPANFQLSGVSSSGPVTAGGTVDVTATVQNTGDQQGTQTVALSVDGTERDSQSVTLAGGASRTITLSWATESGDAGEYTATLTTTNDSTQTSVSVTEQPTAASFAVSGVSSNSPVTAGETVDVTATVTNTGDLEGTQTVSLGINGAIEDSQQVTLAGGASQQVTLSWQTEAGETGTFTASVASDNETAATDVTVEAQPDPANFTITGTSTNSPVTAGDTVEVTATVQNTGDLEGTQTVQLTDGSASLDSRTVTLAGGTSQQVTLSWQTTADDVGDNTLTVRTDDDTATASVSVTEQPNPANFAVSGVSAPESVTAGDTVDVTATVTNTGDLEGTQTVSLAVGGTVDRRVDDQQVTLAGGASQQVTFSWQTEAGQTGNFSLTVVTANDSFPTSVFVEAQPDPANFAVSNVQSNSPVTAGETVDVTATVTNTGDLEGTQTVSLGVNGAVEDSQQVTLAGGASQQVTLSWQTEAGETGTFTASVASDNETAATDVTVEAQPDPASFQVSNLQTNTPVTAGDALNATVTVTNTGDQEGTQTVRLGIRSGTTSDSQEDSQQLTLAGGASRTITLTWQTAAGDAGNYTAGVFTLDGSARTSVTVEEQPDPAAFQIENVQSNSPVTAGETVEVTATITNVGDLEGSQTVELAVVKAGGVTDSQQLTLAGGASQQVTLTWQTAAGDAGTTTARIASTNFARDVSVTVEPQPDPANLTITGTSSNSPVTEGQILTVDATVRNDGDLQGTQTVDLTVANTVRDSQQVTLAAGASQTINLTWATTEGDAGDYTATVTTANDTATEAVTVESATIQPTAIEGTAEDGYVLVGGSGGQQFNVTECPNGQPPNSSVQCLGVDADVNSDGSFYAAPSDVDFPNQTVSSPIGEYTVVVTAPNGLSGTLDTETGRTTINGTLKIHIPGLDAENGDCGTSFVVNATTGTSGTLTGTPLSISGTTASGTVVDGEFSVPGASGCRETIITNYNEVVNSQVGLPASSGENELDLDLFLDLTTAS
ncbi:beta strand repeat-containing protein [Halorientalis pallida]|uniref:beta strand repeat-containing protein n=1 Tax=Halorientalis pallida TaxID=2479928 RepID=UPI003C6F86AA